MSGIQSYSSAENVIINEQQPEKNRENFSSIEAREKIPQHGYYWDTKHAQVVAFAKQVIGAPIGKTLDDSIEGTLRP